MSRSEDRNYFIVKHGLDAFTALPGFIWRTGLSRRKIPRGFRQVGVGDRWIEFAYMVDEENYEPCSLVTGFYECVKEKWYGDVPVDRMPREFNKWDEKAWMIEGKTFGKQPGCPVTVPSINDMLWEFRQKKVVGRTALIRISREEFDHIRDETFRLELDPRKIPLLEREPVCEQEVLSVVVAGHDKPLGIDKILEVQTRFPDMLVEIDGEQIWLELEVRSLDFSSHAHIEQLRRISKGKFKGKREAKRVDKDDTRKVAILCWVDNDKNHELKKSVRGLHIFELQSLLRTGGRIRFS